MASLEQLGVLKQGSQAWNEWRGRNPEAMPRLAGVSLMQAHLSRADLHGAHLHVANWSG